MLDGCSQLALDIQAGKEDTDWSEVDDSEIKKAMRSKDDWVNKLGIIHNEFIQYEALVTTWNPAGISDEESDYSQIDGQFAVVKRALEAAVEAVESEDLSRNL